MLLVGLIGRHVLRNAYRGVESLTYLARQMRAHDYTAVPRYQPQGELATVMDAFLDMRRDVLGFETELTGQLARNERTRAELEHRELFQRLAARRRAGRDPGDRRRGPLERVQSVRRTHARLAGRGGARPRAALRRRAAAGRFADADLGADDRGHRGQAEPEARSRGARRTGARCSSWPRCGSRRAKPG